MAYSDRTKKLPEYCWKCGTKLTHKKYSCGFDDMTGEEKIGTEVRCPKRFFLFAHYMVCFDENNNEVIEHPYD